MEQSRSGPPPVPPRVDLGETEESALESPERVSVSPLENITGPEIAAPIVTHDKPQPTVQDDKPQPTVKYDKPQPTVKDDKPQPTVKHDKPQPTVKDDKPQPTVKHEKPQPTVKHEKPQLIVKHEKPQLIVKHEKPQPIVKDDKPIDVVTANPPCKFPNTSKPPVSKSTKPVQKKEPPKSRPTISIISAHPMDQASSFPSVQFKSDKADLATNETNVNNNINVQQSVTAQVTERTPGLKKPSKPGPPAPRKSPPKLDDKNPKPADAPRKLAPVPSLRSKTKSSKRNSGSVFYIDASADSSIGTTSTSTPINDKPSIEVTHKSKQAASQPNNKSKPTLPAPRKSKTKDEQKSEIAPVVNTKVKPPDKTISKPKLKPTIITAKTPKQLVGSKDDGVKNSSLESVNTSSVSKALDENRPSRPSFPPSDNTEEVNRNENQPVRPKAPPNTTKEEKKAVEKKREQKKDPKNEQSEKKRPKSKPARPPMAKESARLKPSRPAPAKPSVTRKSSSKANGSSKSEKTTTDNSALPKPSGPPRAQAKFDYTGETDDDLTFKAGDTILLTSKVDDDWLVGYLENNVMHQGLFPSSFVDIVVALKEQPDNQENKKSVPPEPHAVALHDFQGQSEGELSFSSGQTIILLERINVEWLKGKSSDIIGIFPANFVQIEHDLPLTTSKSNVETTPLGLTDNNVKETVRSEEWCRAIHDYQGEHTGDLSFAVGTKIKIIERVSPDWFKGECSGKCGVFPASFVEFIAEVRKASQETSLVTALHNYPGENPGDLSFKTGDKIKVIEKINSEWLMGECNGKQGLFPASFVEAEQSESVIQTDDKENIRMAKAIQEFTGKNPGELHFSVGDVIQVQREIDTNWSEGIINDVSGIFPTAFVEIQPSVSKDEIYAKALYDFAGESEHDLSFKAGDIIRLLEHVNEDWCTGIAGEKTGHFPSSFVEILASR